MPRWNIVTIIAGINFSGCRAVILDGHNFTTAWRGSVTPTASGRPHVQRVHVGVRGVSFGVKMTHADAELINDLRAAVAQAESLGQGIRVQMQDALYTIDVWATPDYNQQSWLTHGAESEGIIDDVQMRFVALDAYA